MSLRRIDITRDHCPMTFVKTKLELEKLQPGDRLEVLLSEGEPLDNVPRSAAAQGYVVAETVHVAGAIYRVTIEKVAGDQVQPGGQDLPCQACRIPEK